ncbi:MAG TPA: sulfatase [Nitriliruptorales bacterium]
MGSSDTRPNILFVIADDQSWPHAGAYGCTWVSTPGFDRVAAEGVLFEQAFCSAPQCSPARAAALTGRPFWQLAEASLLAGLFPKELAVYPDLLEAHGYAVGHTGKGWGPGNWKAGGRTRNPAGPEFNEHRDHPPSEAQAGTDYTRNFLAFLETRGPGQPFCFWFGAREPHRPYEEGSGRRQGGDAGEVVVPGYLPDDPRVRSDLLDYAAEIAWYDRHLGAILDELDERGELDRTLVVCTADNGMPFPRAKCNLYPDSCQVPMALRWGERSWGGHAVTDFVTFEDLLPTFLEAAGIEVPDHVVGRSLLPLVDAQRSGRIDPARDHVLTGRERHVHCRPDNRGYPSRAIRTDDHLYVINYAPDRWPVGGPDSYYADTDGGPTKFLMVGRRFEPGIDRLFDLAFAKRPAAELYDLRADQECLDNRIDDPSLSEVRARLHARLTTRLRELDDPRELGSGDAFDAYPYFQGPWVWHDRIPGFKQIGAYNHL